MAHPDSYLPIDQTVKIPEAVRKAAAAADVHYVPAPAPEPSPQPANSPANVSANPDQPVNIVIIPEPRSPGEPRPILQQPEPVQASPQPDPTPPEGQVGTAEQEHHRYLSMKGRYDQSIQTMAGMQEQLRELGAAVEQLTSAPPRPAAPTQPARLLTPEDERTYGPELLDTVQRAARQAIAPDLHEISRRQEELDKREQRLANQNTLDALDTQLPNWRQINTNPDFLAWLRLPDIYSGGVRGQLLRQAFQAASVPRVLAFFKGYLAEAQATGHLPVSQPSAATPAPSRVAAVPLETLAAPGRAQPAPGSSQVPADKPHFTHKQIAEFYSHAGMQRYVGREADRRADEQLIFEAQREGRIH